MRDVIITALVFGLLPFCFLRPYVGILVWSWLGYMNPHKLTWDFAYDFPFAEIVAIATLTGFSVLYFKKGSKPKLPWTIQTVALVLLWIIYTASTIYSLRPDFSWAAWEQISKTLLITFLTLLLIDDEKKLRYLIIVIALSIGFYGLKGGIFSILNGGKYMVFGPGGMIGANNMIGLALNMILPMLYYLSKSEQNRWFRHLLRAIFYLSIVAIVFTYSRGALLSLFVVLTFLFLRSKIIYKVLIAVALIVSYPVITSMLPEQWRGKMESVTNYENDGSAVSRIEAWKTSWNLGLSKPFLGGGFNAIYDEDIYSMYHPTGRLQSVSGNHKTGAHSIYFEVIGENGFIAFGLFVFLIVSTIFSARRLRKKHREETTSNISNYASMLDIGIIAYAIGGAFLETAGFDLFYHLVALNIILKQLDRKSVESGSPELEPAFIRRPAASPG